MTELPECPNCGARDYQLQGDVAVCSYCDTQFAVQFSADHATHAADCQATGPDKTSSATPPSDQDAEDDCTLHPEEQTEQYYCDTPGTSAPKRERSSSYRARKPVSGCLKIGFGVLFLTAGIDCIKQTTDPSDILAFIIGLVFAILLCFSAIKDFRGV